MGKAQDSDAVKDTPDVSDRASAVDATGAAKIQESSQLPPDKAKPELRPLQADVEEKRVRTALPIQSNPEKIETAGTDSVLKPKPESDKKLGAAKIPGQEEAGIATEIIDSNGKQLQQLFRLAEIARLKETLSPLSGKLDESGSSELSRVNELGTLLDALSPALSIFALPMDKISAPAQALDSAAEPGKVAVIPADWARLNYVQLYERIGRLGKDELPPPGVDANYIELKFKDALEIEKSAGVFGPARRQAYQNLLGWFEQTRVPALATAATQFGVALEGNLPQALAADGQPVQGLDLESLSVLWSRGLLKASIGIDAKVVPSANDIERLNTAFAWELSMKQKIVQSQLDFAEKDIMRRSKELGLSDEKFEKWKRKEGEDQAAWIKVAERDLKIFEETYSHIQTMVNLYKASAGKFPLALPSDTVLVVRDKSSGKDIAISSAFIKNGKLPGTFERILKDGELRLIDMKVVSGHEASPENEALRNDRIAFLEKVSPAIRQGVRELYPLLSNHESLIRSGDMPSPTGFARFEKQGLAKVLFGDKAEKLFSKGSDRETIYQEFLKPQASALSMDIRKAIVAGLKWYDKSKITESDDKAPPDGLRAAVKKEIDSRVDKDPFKAPNAELVLSMIAQIRERENLPGKYLGTAEAKDKPKSNELIRPVTLTGHAIEIESINEGEHKGKYKVTQKLQAWKGSWYAVQDIRGLMDSVGDATVVSEKILSADDWVPVADGSSVKLLKAKELSRYRAVENAWYYGHKGVALGFDAGFTLMAAIGIGASWGTATPGALAAKEGGKLAVRAAMGEAAVELSVTQARWLLAKQVGRFTLGASGVLNNTDFNQLKWGEMPVGQYINTARGIIFMADIGHNLFNSAQRAARSQLANLKESSTIAEKMLPFVSRPPQAAPDMVVGLLKQNNRLGAVSVYESTGVAFNYVLTPLLGVSLVHDYLKEIEEKPLRSPARDITRSYGSGHDANLRLNEFVPANHLNNLNNVEVQKFEMLARKFNAAESLPEQKVEIARLAALADQLGKEPDRGQKLEALKATLLKSTTSKDRALAAFSAITLLELEKKADGGLPEIIGKPPADIATEKLVKDLRLQLFGQELNITSLSIGQALLELKLVKGETLARHFAAKVESRFSQEAERILALRGLSELSSEDKVALLESASFAELKDALLRNYFKQADLMSGLALLSLSEAGENKSEALEFNSKKIAIADMKAEIRSRMLSEQLSPASSVLAAAAIDLGILTPSQSADNFLGRFKSSNPDEISLAVNSLIDSMRYSSGDRQYFESIQKQLIANLKSDNPGIVAFSGLTLLFSAQTEKGNIPEELGSGKTRLASRDLVELLKKQLFQSELQESSRILGSGLSRLGFVNASTLAGSYLDRLEKKDGSMQDKLLAFKFLLPVAARLHNEWEQTPDSQKTEYMAKNFGLSLPEIEARLMKLAASPEADGTGVPAQIRVLSSYLARVLNEPKATQMRKDLIWLDALLKDNSGLPDAQQILERMRVELSAGKAETDYQRFVLAQTLISQRAIKDLDPQNYANMIVPTLGKVAQAERTVVFDRVIDSLPGFLSDISARDQKAANEILEKFMEAVLKPPSSSFDAQFLAKAIAQFQKIYAQMDPVHASSFQSRLKDFVRPGSKFYCKDFPELRKLALESLSSVSLIESADLLKTLISAEAYSVNDRVIQASESNPIVREAALKALLKSRDPEIHSLAAVLFKSETNQKLSSILSELKGKADESELFSHTVIAAHTLLKDSFPFLRNFGPNEASAWLKQHSSFSLLSSDALKAAYEADSKVSTSWFDRRLDSNAELASAEKKAVSGLAAGRMEQFSNLLKLSLGGGVESQKAKMTLFYIATAGGLSLGSDSSALNVKGWYYEAAIENEKFQELAAKALADDAVRGSTLQGLSRALLRAGVESSNERVRTAFLAGFEDLLASDPIAAADKFRSILDSELERPLQAQSQDFQLHLLTSISRLPPQIAEPMLKRAMAENPFSSVRHYAREKLLASSLELEPSSLPSSGPADSNAKFLPFSINDSVAWINKEYPLLNLESYIKEFNAVAARHPHWSQSDLPYWLRSAFDWTGTKARTVAEIEKAGGDVVRRERLKQFDELQALAADKSSPDASKAQYSLYYIATNAGAVLGADGVGFVLAGNEYKELSKNDDYQVKAARALVSLLDSGADAGSELGRMVLNGLYHSESGRARTEFLKGLHKLTAYSKDSDKPEDLAAADAVLKILKKVIENEFARPPALQDDQFKDAVIDSLVYYRSEISLPLLKIFEQSGLSDNTRRHASKMIEMVKKSKEKEG